MTNKTDHLAAQLFREIASIASPKRRSTSPMNKSMFCESMGCTERQLMQASRALHNRGDVVALDLGDTIAFAMKREPGINDA